MPRAEFPLFKGDNPIEWIRKCRYFFEIHQVPERYKTRYASLYFHGRADEWYGGYIIHIFCVNFIWDSSCYSKLPCAYLVGAFHSQSQTFVGDSR